jgi:hypothetical protein
MGFLGSPRTRRRLLWVGGLLLVTAVAAAAVVALPKGHQTKEVFRPGAWIPSTPKDAPMTPARRRAVDLMLDTFVPAAVERKDPMRALPLVTAAFRSGTSRQEWSRGQLPVFPYDTRNRSFHAWTLNYSYPREMSVEILLHPAQKETLGTLAFTAVLKETKGRWLVDSFVPSASFAPQKKTPKILAQPDFTPFADGRGSNRLSAQWLLLPATVLALIVLVPIGIGLAKLHRSRRAWRDYQASASLDRGT